MSTTLDNGSHTNLNGSISIGTILLFDPFLGGRNRFERWSSYWLRASHHRRTGTLSFSSMSSSGVFIDKDFNPQSTTSIIPVYDNNDQAVFVLLGDAGRELTGKHASGLVDKYFEANGDLGPDHEMPACPTSFDRHHWSNT
ncbi:BnaC07g16910D [Brassica napus]|uniref:(rape) hypothetical protein n=1 Tax=Brassica napus TaxID=3708 RepID=A0A078GZ65_BRANA|nr:unnamed protein product [Brassica napus]CDY30791.1 BnaC07g16910D [Brassica napus]